MQIYSTLLRYSVRLLARRAYSENEIRKKLNIRAARIKQYTGKRHDESESAIQINPGERSEPVPQSEQQMQIDRVIQQLFALKYLDDAAFAKNFIAAELRRKPQSLRLIKQKLVQKGLSSEQIENAICSRSMPRLGGGEQKICARRRPRRGGGAQIETPSSPPFPSELQLAKSAAEKKLKILNSGAHGQSLSPLKKKEKLYRFLAARGFSSEVIFKSLNTVI